MLGRVRGPLAYASAIVLAAAAYLGLCALGPSADAPAPAAGAPLFAAGTGGVHVDVLLHVLIALVIVTAAARLLGQVCERVRQPRVIGEVIAGIALGPSLLGRAWPAAAAFVLPPSVAPFLQLVAQVGVVLYMFLVGVELDLDLLRRRGRAAIGISHASIVVPFLLGSALALWLYPRVATSDVPFTAFSLFMGVSMSVTAFPVLARILTDRRMQRSTIGVVALACAAVDDVTAWCLLAVVVGVTRAEALGALATLGWVVAYLVAAVVVLRPLVRALVQRVEARGRSTQGDLAQVLLLVLGSAIATSAAGIHAVFGAFVVGAFVGPRSVLGRALAEQIGHLVTVLFLPAFFACTGMRTQIGLVSGAAAWALCGVIVVCACAGKLGGSAIAARACGFSWRDAASIGVLMNTRGLMELIVLDIGLELRVISPTLFSMLVVMAVVTTFATTPALALLERQATEPEPAPIAA